MNKFDAASNMSMFLLEKTGSVCGIWKGKMLDAKQCGLFGIYLGKGEITIDGQNESLGHTIKVCFGLDYYETYNKKWTEL